MWTRLSCQGIRVQTGLSRELPAEESRLSWGPFKSQAVPMVLFWAWLPFFFFFNSQDFGCYNPSSSSWSAGYWLAGAAVTSEKGSQSEQDSPCLPAANSWSSNKQDGEVQSLLWAAAWECPFPEQSLEERENSKAGHKLGVFTLTPSGALDTPTFHPGSFFFEYLAF